MKSFIEFLEEDTLNEVSPKQLFDVARAVGGAVERVGASNVVKNIAKSGEEKLASILRNINLRGPGVQGTGKELSTTGKAKVDDLVKAKEGEYIPKSSNVPAKIEPMTYKPLEPAAQTSSKTLVAPQVSTNTDTKTLTAPEPVTKTDTKTVTPTKSSEPPKPPKPPIGQEPIPPKPFRLPNWVLGKSGFLSQNPGYAPSIKGHGRFYSP
jgi:hypothetical protein